MTDAKCEPSPELRGVDGWHWVKQAEGATAQPAWRRADIGWWGTIATGLRGHSDTETYAMGWRYVAPVTPPATVAALVEALEQIANHPEANRELIDYGPDGKQRRWPTVCEEARAALAAYRASAVEEGA